MSAGGDCGVAKTGAVSDADSKPAAIAKAILRMGSLPFSFLSRYDARVAASGDFALRSAPNARALSIKAQSRVAHTEIVWSASEQTVRCWGVGPLIQRNIFRRRREDEQSRNTAEQRDKSSARVSSLARLGLPRRPDRRLIGRVLGAEAGIAGPRLALALLEGVESARPAAVEILDDHAPGMRSADAGRCGRRHRGEHSQPDGEL